jgi:serine O-acetyltransferase
VREWRGPDLEDHAPLGLRELLREDWETHRRSFLMPGLHALALHRISVWGTRQPRPVRFLVRALAGSLNVILIQNVYGLELFRTTVVGRRVLIAHHQGVILGSSAVIGDDCLIRQNVTLGQSKVEDRSDDQPRVGRGVQFGAGATVVGPVHIGDGARIGPGAVVTTDVPAGATAFAPRAVIKPRAELPEQG